MSFRKLDATPFNVLCMTLVRSPILTDIKANRLWPRFSDSSGTNSRFGSNEAGITNP